MPADPIYSETVTLKASALADFPTKAAIDLGSRLAKIIFVPKDAPCPEKELVTLTCLTFANEQFEDALHAMKQQADLPGSGHLHVTGAVTETHTTQIKNVLGLDALHIDGTDLRSRGVFLLLDSPDIDANFHPQLAQKGFLFDMFEEDFNRFKSLIQQSDGPFPALLIHVGTDSEMYAISKEGKASFIGRVPMAGQSILGLANLMTGVTDYDALMALASAGDRTKVDLMAKDVMDPELNTEFGKIPMDMPIFPFSKGSDPDWSVDECEKSDIAQALMALVPSLLETYLYGLIFANGAGCIYVTGNFFRAEITRNVFYQKMATITDQMGIKIKFIKTGHCRAIAAMLTNQGEEKTFVEANKKDTMMQFV